MPTKDDFGFNFIRKALVIGGRVALFDGTNSDGYSVERIEGDNTMTLKPINMSTKKGGKRAGAGRPPKPPAEKRRTIGLTLTPDAIDALRSIGNGSASQGVYKLLEASQGVYDLLKAHNQPTEPAADSYKGNRHMTRQQTQQALEAQIRQAGNTPIYDKAQTWGLNIIGYFTPQGIHTFYEGYQHYQESDVIATEVWFDFKETDENGDWQENGESVELHYVPNATPLDGQTIKAQVLYDLRELTGFISGTDLHDLFREVLDGEPSPSGATEIQVAKLQQSILGQEALKLLNAPLYESLDSITEYTR